ncbi:uncharacterized protein EI90DRAFT_3155339 [Cantharellus anzutake]|uniref:uncharacterized protein n=1 Tax=Cantharellus anzutake TaxID=1750568 RepID=UPI0019074328|nr:uncharacterized protein EI90DRAFT_3155339 [Cantharellus anzutake]KAF8329443.1 hypothetical protein EI90DRAFT_3155339 [Cantharellus anzutake]
MDKRNNKSHSMSIKFVRPQSTSREGPRDKSALSKEKVREDLQKEFCPAIDSALVEALLMERAELSESWILEMKSTLRQLAAGAGEATTVSHTTSQGKHVRGEPDDSASLSESLSTSLSLRDSSLSGLSLFSTPPEFLRSIFPNIPNQLLERTLESHGWPPKVLLTEDISPDIDMDVIVNYLIGVERETNGMEHDMSEDDVPDLQNGSGIPRGRVESGNVNMNGNGSRRGKGPKPKPILIVDTLQRQHMSTPSANRPQNSDAQNPWSHVDSLATYLSTLLPQTSYSQFLGLFHDPSYATTADALRGYLNTAPSTSSETHGLTGRITERDAKHLVELFSPVASEEAGNLYPDAKACLKAAGGDKAKAFDVLSCLHDLGKSETVIRRSVAHSEQSPSESRFSRGKPPPTSAAGSNVASMSSTEWVAVHNKRHKLSAREESRNSALLCGPDEGGDGTNNSETAEGVMGKVETLRSKRKEASALLQAADHWKKRHRLGGGGAAEYYASRARGLYQEIEEVELCAARMQVESARQSDGKTVDFHGLSVKQCSKLSREFVEAWWSSAKHDVNHEPFTIITGWGKHSSGHRGKLGPAVNSTLKKAGWDVRIGQGKVIVMGKR